MSVQFDRFDQRVRAAMASEVHSMFASVDLRGRVRSRIATAGKPRDTRYPARSRRPSAPRWRFRINALVATLALLFGANLAGVYLAPAYGHALADVPALGGISQPVLRAFGIDDRNAVALHDSSTSARHTLNLVAGYADGLRTVILLNIDGRGLTGNPKLYGIHPGDFGISPDHVRLTDQFGHVYKANGLNTATDLQFEPLVWPASALGARLTLQVDGLERQWLAAGQTRSVLPGSWTLHASVIPAATHALIAPAPVSTALGTFKLTSVRVTGTELELRWTVSGLINDRADTQFYPAAGTRGPASAPPDMALSRSYFTAAIYDPSGQPLPTLESSGEWPKGQPFQGILRVSTSGPGRYRLQLADVLIAPGDQRWIDIP
jgi:hypothetical protein